MIHRSKPVTAEFSELWISCVEAGVKADSVFIFASLTVESTFPLDGHCGV